eukprot:scaffold4496_cov128-Isochrysis_galbana.AAC.8
MFCLFWRLPTACLVPCAPWCPAFVRSSRPSSMRPNSAIFVASLCPLLCLFSARFALCSSVVFSVRSQASHSALSIDECSPRRASALAMFMAMGARWGGPPLAALVSVSVSTKTETERDFFLSIDALAGECDRTLYYPLAD